jgi:hypothetical protein
MLSRKIIRATQSTRQPWFGCGRFPALMYDPNINGNVKAHSVRIRLDGMHVLATDNGAPANVNHNPNAPAVLEGYNGGFPWGDHAAVLDADGYLWGEAPGNGTQAIQRVNTATPHDANHNNICEPTFEAVGTGQLGVTGTSPRIRYDAGVAHLYVPIIWSGLVQSSPRSDGLIAVVSTDLLPSHVSGLSSLAAPEWANGWFAILSQDLANNIWFLTRTATDNTFFLSRNFGTSQAQTAGPFHIPAFVATVASTNPLQYFNDGNGHLIFLMADGSIQQWSITGDPNITFVQTIAPIAGIQINDTAIMFERLQPNNVVRGGFFISYTNGAGHAAIGLVSLSTFAIIETYDLSTVRFQNASALPIANFRDVDYNASSRELHLVLVANANTWKIPL